MKKTILIDLDLYAKDKNNNYGCSYFHHYNNFGVMNIVELATYAIVCRRCELACCITACPNEALEKGEDKILRKFNMRCTGCRSCSHACPFGVIFPEMMAYLAPKCDLCLDRLSGDEIPECAGKSQDGIIKYGEFKEDKANSIYSIGTIFVKAEVWQRNGEK